MDCQHIKEKRNGKWTLEAICNELPDLFELRPLPPSMEPTNALQHFDMESIRQRFSEEMRDTIEQMAAAQMQELKQQHEELIKRLPAPRDPHS